MTNLKGIKISLFILFQVFFIQMTMAQDIRFSSPDEQLKITLTLNDKISWDAAYLVGMNASRYTQDYNISTKTIDQNTKFGIQLSGGGGYDTIFKKSRT